MDGWMYVCMYVCIYVCIYVSICVGVLNTTCMSYHVLLIDLLYIKDALMPAVTCNMQIPNFRWNQSGCQKIHIAKIELV